MGTIDLPVLRFDVTTNDWVLFAPARARRPHSRSGDEVSNDASPCPFCPGNEHLAAEELLREPDEHGVPWRVRVVRNKYPALDPAASPDQTGFGPGFRQMGGYGVHEVVIESPEHSLRLPEQSADQVERVLRVLHTRFTRLMTDPRLRAIVAFKNQGERAGTSLAHPHWQLIATPVVPSLLRHKHIVATEYFDRTGASLYTVALEEELAAQTRVLASNAAFVALLPFASHVPYQIRILPREPRGSFAHVQPHSFRPLAEILRDVLSRLDRALDAPDFNLTVATAPLGDENEPYFIWHIDVLPRLTTPAGFELGSGMAINPVLPEDAVVALRAAEIREESPG
ncbi:MAG TPA: DUF4931 domain-containing protein [Polyangiaceae bacterium]